jgi:hypothetical protein
MVLYDKLPDKIYGKANGKQITFSLRGFSKPTFLTRLARARPYFFLPAKKVSMVDASQINNSYIWYHSRR